MIGSKKRSTAGRILVAAGELFSIEGVRSTTVDSIAARAKVCKRTLYYHFRSKDDLIGQWLALEDAAARRLYGEWLGPPGEPMERALTGLFEHLARSAEVPRWKGCGFARAATELAGMPGHPGVRAAKAHKSGLEAWIGSRLRDDGLEGADKLARRVVLLLEGAVIQVLVHHDTGYMREAGEMAAELVAGARTAGTTRSRVGQ